MQLREQGDHGDQGPQPPVGRQPPAKSALGSVFPEVGLGREEALAGPKGGHVGLLGYLEGLSLAPLWTLQHLCQRRPCSEMFWSLQWPRPKPEAGARHPRPG